MTNTIAPPAQQPVQQQPQTNGKATASLVLGIVSLFFNPLAIATLLGIIFGAIGIKRSAALGGRGKAVTGIVLSVVGFISGIIAIVLIMSMLGAGASAASQALESAPAAIATEAAATQADDAADDSKADAASDDSAKDVDSLKDAVEDLADAASVPAEFSSAVFQAQTYSDTMHMSKKDILDQLTSEYGGQFTKKAAKYALKHIDADWNANALASAETYQDTMHMSPADIHDQLTSEYGAQFTEAQADYAIAHLSK